MAAFTAKDVQALRVQTGVGMMDCKNALTAADGDFEKAVDILREKGLAAAAKKAGRIAAEGIVDIVIDGGSGAVIEVNSETDFVSKNESFREFVKLCARTIISEQPKDVEALHACKAPLGTIEEELREKILTIGENIKIRRFEYYEGILISYIHGGGTHAVMVKFDTSPQIADMTEFTAFGRDVAMQIAASAPLYVSKDQVPSAEIDKERTILLAQALNEGKTQNIAEKMVEGRIGKYYKDVVLLEQPFVKDDKMSVADYVKNTAAALGGEIKISAFTRYEKGEGLEKRSDDFAKEVADMQK